MEKIGKEITKDSSPEEVLSYFKSKDPESELNNLAKENIFGDVLSLLDKRDYKELGIKKGPQKKIQKYIEDNLTKLTRNEIEITVNKNSNEKDVELFLENYLNFKTHIKHLEGNKLFSLSEKDMKNIGLNIGQRKRLKMYIEYAQKIEKDNMTISKTSTRKQVELFLKNKFNMSDKIIKDLDLDGESLFLLTEEDIDEYEEIPLEIKNEFKNFIFQKNNNNDIKTIKENENINKEDKESINDSKIKTNEQENDLKSNEELINNEKLKLNKKDNDLIFNENNK